MTEIYKSRIEGGRRLRNGPRPLPPLVSIVTVVFRALQELPPLLESIVALSADDIEVIVIDGGSDDGTLDVLRRFENSIDYWVSEPDKGIYDAMNKGVAAATGEYILHLNAGDRLRYIPRQELQSCRADKIDLAAFSVDMEGFGIHRPRRSQFMSRFSMTCHHQGTFYRREGHLGYDTQFRVHADFDLNQRMLLAGKSVRCCDVVVSKMGDGGLSAKCSYRDGYRIIGKNFGFLYVCIAFLWRRVSPVIPPLKRLLNR
jgi:glycosyltransferase involved in cell wall biosynthesis